MNPSFNNPFDALVALQRALDARAGSEWIGRGTAAGGSYPPVNIFQQGDDFIAVLELPGVAKDDLAIEAKENTLRISGRKAIDYGEGASIHRRERLASDLAASPGGLRHIALHQFVQSARRVENLIDGNQLLAARRTAQRRHGLDGTSIGRPRS